ncbi:hypothetical protein AB0N29_00995 [Nocardioides sp. NPDC092400]|uniref:hypothetical protein n=1 Tax=Nocardioides sp. NPDC092400 TaxID=3155196 RepID=UPI003448CEEE
MSDVATNARRLADRIADSVVTVSIPNERVFGEVRGERRVKVWFAPGHYARVAPAQLERELSTLARLLFAAALREHAVAQKEVTGRVFERRIPLGRRDREYAAALESLAAEGASDDGSVTVRAVGQQAYTVGIAPGALDRLPEDSFRHACAQAAESLLRDTEKQAAIARVRIHEPLPGFSLDDLRPAGRAGHR